MGTKYSSQATSGYDSSPPPDDGTQVAANLITWSGVKTKLTNVLKTFAEAINTALVSALDLSARSIGSNDTAIASDHWKTLQVTGATTIQLSSAASMGAGYEVGVFNAGASTVTVTPAGSDTINLLSASVTIPINGTIIFRTNQALTGYNIVSQSNSAQTLTASGLVTLNGGTATSAGSPAVRVMNDKIITFLDSAAGATNCAYLWQDSSNLLHIGSKGLDSIKVNGNVLGIGSSTPSTSGAGITFPATQSASSDVNTLDDYEEGTWTPSVGGTATYTIQSGAYTKTGRMVAIVGTISINTIGTGSTTAVSGLPFTCAANTAISVSSATALATNMVSVTAAIGAAGTSIAFNGRTVASASESNSPIFGNGAGVNFAGVYFV